MGYQSNDYIVGWRAIISRGKGCKVIGPYQIMTYCLATLGYNLKVLNMERCFKLDRDDPMLFSIEETGVGCQNTLVLKHTSTPSTEVLIPEFTTCTTGTNITYYRSGSICGPKEHDGHAFTYIVLPYANMPDVIDHIQECSWFP